MISPVASASLAQPILDVGAILIVKLWPFVIGAILFKAIKVLLLKFGNLRK